MIYYFAFKCLYFNTLVSDDSYLANNYVNEVIKGQKVTETGSKWKVHNSSKKSYLDSCCRHIDTHNIVKH